MGKEIKNDKDLYMNEEIIDGELLKDSLEDIADISADIGDLNFDDEEIEDIDFEFEDLFLDDFQKFDKEFNEDSMKEEKMSIESQQSQKASGNYSIESENHTHADKISMEETTNLKKRRDGENSNEDDLLTGTSEGVDEGNFDMDSLLAETSEEANEETGLDMDSLLAETSEEANEENFDMDSLLTEASEEANEENFDMDSLLTEASEGANEETGFDMDSLLAETSEEANEENFDMDSLLTEASEGANEETGFDMDSLLMDGVNEEEFEMDKLDSDDGKEDSESDSLKDILNTSETDNFSLEGLFDGDLDFSSSSDDNTSLEGQDSTLDNLENMLDSSILDAMPDAEEMALTEEKKEKKKGIFASLFGNVKDEKWEKQKAKEQQKEEERRLKEAEKKKAKEEAEEGEKELTKEEKKAAKKAEKEAKKAAKKEAREQAKKEKEEKKAQEKEASVEEVIEDEGRINKVGASIVFVFFGVCAISVVVGTNMFSYHQNIKNATNLFDVKKYSEAYEQIRGLKVKSKDEEIYNKIITVMYVDKQLNSYNNYYGIKLYPEALDSLLKGLDKYDKHLYEAKQLGVKEDFDYVKSEILTELGNTFEVSEQEAYDIIDMQDKEKYSEKVRKIANGEE